MDILNMTNEINDISTRRYELLKGTGLIVARAIDEKNKDNKRVVNDITCLFDEEDKTVLKSIKSIRDRRVVEDFATIFLMEDYNWKFEKYSDKEEN